MEVSRTFLKNYESFQYLVVHSFTYPSFFTNLNQFLSFVCFTNFTHDLFDISFIASIIVSWLKAMTITKEAPI